MINNKGNAVVWVIVVVLLAVGGWFLLSSDDGEDGETATSTEQATGTEATSDENISEIQSAIAGDGSIECTYTRDEMADATSYIEGGQVRTIAQVEGMTSNMLFQDEEIYVWQEGAAEGFIMTADADEESNQTPVPVRPGDVEEAAGMEDVSCVEADVDDALFELPEDVEFMAMPDMAAGASGQMQTQ